VPVMLSDGIPAIWSALVDRKHISPGPLTDDDEQSPASRHASKGVLPVICERDPRSNDEVLDG